MAATNAMIHHLRILFLAGLVSCAHLAATRGADFNVTTPGFAFKLNSTDGNPAITLIRGRTYTFAVSTASIHPFRIGTTVFGSVPPGVSGENTSSGTVTFVVPTNAANCVYYCGVHGSSLSAAITMINPPAPPAFQLTALTVTTNLRLRHTATNGFTYTPEFSTNLTATNWFALTVQSNNLANGTNEVICGKPPGSNVFIRVRAQ